MDNNIKSVTNYNGEVIDQTSWIEKNYHVNLGGDKSGKEPKQMPVLKHRRIERQAVVHPSEREARTKEKAAEANAEALAAEKVRAANKTDLKKRNIK